MREIKAADITAAVARLAIEANFDLGERETQAIRAARETEDSPVGRTILDQLLENAEIARNESMPICQDTGVAVVFADLGQDARVVGGEFELAVEEGVRQGYQEGYLRKSMCHPFTRKNTGDNTPAVIHLRLVPGDGLRLRLAPKGGGSENMSALWMMKPADGIDGVREAVIQRVSEAGPNPCPPIVVGVGIGGNFETCALLAKKALLRPLGEPNPDPELARLERELDERIRDLGIGPQGLGGRTTALGVHVEMMPCHIASLPVAVNIQCHAARHKEAVL